MYDIVFFHNILEWSKTCVIVFLARTVPMSWYILVNDLDEVREDHYWAIQHVDTVLRLSAS